MIFNLLIGDEIGNVISTGLRTFFGNVVAPIYELIEYLYKLFDIISRTEILENDFIQNIYSKVGLILGLFMIFKLMFSLVNSLISPDKLDDKKNGAAAIIQRSVIAIVLLGITPTLFDEAFKIQRLIVGNTAGQNVLYKLISNSSTTSNVDVGHSLATGLYLSFFTDNEAPKLNNGTNDEIYDEEGEYHDRFQNNDYETLKRNLEEGNIKFTDTVEYLTIKDTTTNQYVIEYNWLVLLIVGVVVAWMLGMYCIQAAIRVVQLSYLQLIAPIPILSYISDPEGSFKRWIKQCTSTYLDLFFRLAVIYFVMTMVREVLEQFDDFSGVIFETSGLIDEKDAFTLGLVKILIVIGLLLFAKRAPELLQELFPNLGKGPFSYSLNPKKELFEPLKQLYNDTPLGWAPKALGFLGKKAIGYADRKRYHLPKPRGKIGQKLDELMPGRGEYIKNRRQALEDARQWETQEKRGKYIYDRFDGDLIYEDSEGNLRVKRGVFRNSSYAETFLAKTIAKNKVKAAEGEIERLTEDINAVSVDSRLTEEEREYQLGILRKQRDNAKSNLRAAQSALEKADDRHKKNQAIYTDDAETESLFKYYDDTHKSEKALNDGLSDEQLSFLSENEERKKAQLEAERREAAEKERIEEIKRREAAAKEAQAKAEQTQQHFDELNGINRENASDNGAPTEAFSAIAEKYKREDELIQEEIKRREEAAAESRRKAEQAQQHFNELNGVTPSEGNGPKVTAENSLLAQLAEQARQQEMQQEFINRGRTNSNSQTTPNGQNSNNGTPGSSDNS